MPRKSPESVSPAEVEACMSDAAALERVRSHRASVEDYVSEGVIDHMPEEDANGHIDVRIEGHDNVVRALQMNEEFRRYEAEHFDARVSAPIRSDRREAHEEARARKHHVSRPSIIVPEMPWKRGRA